jgi:hypothetical protein
MTKKGTGRIIHETDQEEAMANQIFEQIEASFKFVGPGKAIQSCQVFDNVGWQRRAILIRFTDGTSLRISGENMEIEELDASQRPEQFESPPEEQQKLLHPGEGESE